MKRLNRYYLTGLIVVCAGAAAFFQGCSRTRKGPNLLFITTDTTRADHLSCYGYPNALTPCLQGLSEAGVVFEDAQSCAPITLPSHATMFTGLLPPEHGLRVNGENALAEDIPTLAEILKARGYQTAAVTASVVVDHTYGLARGFDTYDDYFDKEKEKAQKEGAQALGGEGAEESYRPGERVAELALAWLKTAVTGSRAKDPWFLWAHFYDPHLPGHFHRELFGDRFPHSYDAEIAYMDLQIGKLLDFLGEHALKENTLVVVAGDHGEGLGDNGEDSHCFFLYRATQHVPLIMTWKKTVRAGLRVPAAVSLADVMPTVLDAMGQSPDVYRPRADARNARLLVSQKRSFAGALRGEALASRPCYMETLWGFHALHWAPLFGLVNEDAKYIRAPRCELYDRVADPSELTNICASAARRADEMALTLEAWEKRMQKPTLKAASVSAEQFSKLQSLGYTAGGGTAMTGGVAELSRLPESKDMKPLIVLQNRIKLLLTRDPASPDLLKGCQELVKAAPNTAAFHSWLGTALAAGGRKEEAVAEYTEALRLHPEQLEVRNNFGVMLTSLGRYEEALAQFDEAYRRKTHDPVLRDNVCLALEQIGMGLTKEKRLGEAETNFVRIVALKPDSAEARFNLGQLLMLQGKREKAREAYQAALKIRSDYGRAKQALERLAAQPEDRISQTKEGEVK